MKSWRGKCLQKSLIACCGGDRQVRAARVFGTRAANHVGSGLCGSRRQARNFEVVREFLHEEQGHVWVYAAASQRSFLDGEVQGRWRLGSSVGSCVGCLLWLDSGHVVRVVHDEMLRADVAVSPAACAPWFRSCAGAPKRTKQGAHLKGKSNQIVMSGVAARQASGHEGASLAGSTSRGSEVGARRDSFASETGSGSMAAGAVPSSVLVALLNPLPRCPEGLRQSAHRNGGVAGRTRRSKCQPSPPRPVQALPAWCLRNLRAR